MSEKKARIQYWDMAKGFTILLVIIGHIPNVNPYLRGVIFSFFYQELFSYKYRKEIDQKFTDSVCSCMPDIDHMLYGTGMAATVYCESGTYKRKTAGDDHGDQQYLYDPEGNSLRLACLVRGLPVRRKNPLRTGDE